MQRLNVYLHAMRKPPYVLNLDPAVLNLPYEANIDIRDSINYKEVMKQYFPRAGQADLCRYGLGPNGAITTCLNLFATKVDQILGIIEKRAPAHEYRPPPPAFVGAVTRV
jgi:GPN-loop GTPase